MQIAIYLVNLKVRSRDELNSSKKCVVADTTRLTSSLLLMTNSGPKSKSILNDDQILSKTTFRLILDNDLSLVLNCCHHVGFLS